MKSTMTDTAPTWDLTSYFPSFESDERLAFTAALTENLAMLLAQVRGLDPLNIDNLPNWEGVIRAYEEISVQYSHLGSYLNALFSCDAANEAFAAADAAHSKSGATLTKIRTEMMRGLRVAAESEIRSLLLSKKMLGAEWFVRRLQEEAKVQMTSQMEALAADLGVDGISAWGRLYSSLTGKMSFKMRMGDGREEVVPMARRRSLMADPDRSVRKEAFERGNDVFAEHETTFAAGINGIAGTRLTLNRKRGLEHFLDAPLFDNALRRSTLEAMHEGIEASAAELQKALSEGAAALGLERMDWFDLEAPMPSWGKLKYDWASGTELLGSALDRTYPDFAKYYRESLSKRWVEAQSRSGKMPGAYCTGTMLKKEERIYMCYNGSLNDLMTLAHEFGHAWHSHLVEGARRPLASSYPMTLAETASTFGEALLVEGISRDSEADPALRAALADVESNRLHSFLVNIPVRFAFEKTFYEERSSGEVPVSRLKALMEAAQRKYYGDALGATDPYFWASKLHFFITETSFYNFPYAFGYMLSRALFARFKSEGPAFLKRYEHFLIESGSMSCEEAASNALGVDLSDATFWASAIRPA